MRLIPIYGKITEKELMKMADERKPKKKIQEYESFWRAKERYRKTKVVLSLQISPEEKSRIREHASDFCGGNLTGYVMEAVRGRMDKEDREKEKIE